MKPIFSISIIGSGNVAHQLGKALYKNGCKIDIVYNYNINSADNLAKSLNSIASDQPSEIPKNSDLYLVALKDEHISEILSKIDLENALIAHTSGTFNTQLINSYSARAACFYPMQTFTKNENLSIEDTAIFIESSSSKDAQLLEELCKNIHCKPYRINQKQREQMHIAAIATNNFTYHLFSCIQEYCKNNELPYASLKPLFLQTIEMIGKENPFKHQTGPAKRGENTITEKHQDLLKNEKYLADIYSLFTEQINKKHLKK